MRIKSSMALIAMGVGGTLLYQNMKNGNMKKMMNKVKIETKKTMDDLEDMM
ncbi:MAG: hypothetical protein IJI49_05750 [Bacilli bacterium]|nr:hypothetical protein [Bacilli bacterium]